MLKKAFLLLAWIGCMSILVAGASQVGATSIDVADDNALFRAGTWFASENPGPYPAGVAPVTSSAAFGFATDTPLVGDVNGDGVDDVVVLRDVADRNQYFAGQTDTSVVPHQIAGGAVTTTGNFGVFSNTGAHFLADMNGDSYDDVVRVNTPDFNWKFRGSTAAGLTTGNANDSAFFQFGLPGGGDQPIVGDFNGDGLDDVGVYRLAGGNIFWSGTGAGGVLGGLGTGPIGQIGGSAGDTLLIGNLNGDAFDDAVMVRQTGAGLIEWFGLINDGTGNLNFGLPGTTLSSFGLDGVDVPFLADIDGDGLDDIGVTRGGATHFTTFTTAGGALGINGAGDASWDFGLAGDVTLFGDFLGEAIPEPTSLALVVFGVLGLAGVRRHRS